MWGSEPGITMTNCPFSCTGMHLKTLRKWGKQVLNQRRARWLWFWRSQGAEALSAHLLQQSPPDSWMSRKSTDGNQGLVPYFAWLKPSLFTFPGLWLVGICSSCTDLISSSVQDEIGHLHSALPKPNHQKQQDNSARSLRHRKGKDKLKPGHCRAVPGTWEASWPFFLILSHPRNVTIAFFSPDCPLVNKKKLILLQNQCYSCSLSFSLLHFTHYLFC